MNYREALVEIIKESCRAPLIVELGVAKAKLSDLILRSIPDARMILVDTWGASASDDYIATGDPAAKLSQAEQDQRFNTVKEKMSGYGSRCQIFRGKTTDLQLECAEPDFVFIDAEHTYEAVLADIQFWWPLTKHILAGHDYSNTYPGVEKAVRQCFDAWETYPGSIWLVRK